MADHGTICVELLDRSVEPLLASEQPWEMTGLSHCSVLKENGVYRMWYDALGDNAQADSEAYLCHAQSRDGLHWEHVEVGLVEHGGSRANNILIDGAKCGGIGGTSVFLDPAGALDERYKMVFIRETPIEGRQRWPIWAGVSRDGLHWRLGEQPVLRDRRSNDTQNACLCEGSGYRMYCRLWVKDGNRTRRAVGLSESEDFFSFPPPQVVLAPDEHDPPGMDFYTPSVSKLREDLYVLLPTAFDKDTQQCVPHLAWSRDGRRFMRAQRGPVVPLGSGFDSASIYIAPHAIASDEPDAWWFYYSGWNVSHDTFKWGTHRRAGAIGRVLLRIRA